MNSSYTLLLLIFTLIASCKSDTIKSKKISKPENKIHVAELDSIKYQLYLNKQFIKDSLLKENNGVVENYFLKYQNDTCGILTYKNANLKEAFEGIKITRGINTNKQKDTLFVMPSFNNCDIGQSYCFFDKTLPRLYTDSYCCHPENLFVCSDINEDGFNEIGIFYSSCVSRYKSLRIFSLQQDKWIEIGNAMFDVLNQDPTKVKFENLVKKVSKNKFKICNFEDDKVYWKTISFN